MSKFRMRFAPATLSEDLESFLENLADSRKSKDAQVFLASQSGTLFQMAGFIPVEAGSSPTVQSLLDLKRAYALTHQLPIEDVLNTDVAVALRKARKAQLVGRFGGPRPTWETITNG